MKKINTILFVCFIMISSLQAQKVNMKIMDAKTQKEILVGKCNLKGLKANEFGTHFNSEYSGYNMDSITLALLQPKMKNIKIEIIMGTWCGDSKEQVPRFIKILDALNYKTKKLKIICVDRKFSADSFDKKKNNIEKVPTFIIYRKNKEIGRIVEIPMLSLEKDLLEILNKSIN